MIRWPDDDVDRSTRGDPTAARSNRRAYGDLVKSTPRPLVGSDALVTSSGESSEVLLDTAVNGGRSILMHRGNYCYHASVSARSGTSEQPSEHSSDNEYVEALLRASRVLVGVAARSLTEVEADVTLSQYRALVVLAQHGELGVNSFAEAMAIHPSTASRLCDRLVQRGLVDRSPSPESRREVVITLTAAGEALVSSVTVRRRSEIARIVRRIQSTNRAPLIRALEAFGDAAGELPDHAWKLGW